MEEWHSTALFITILVVHKISLQCGFRIVKFNHFCVSLLIYNNFIFMKLSSDLSYLTEYNNYYYENEPSIIVTRLIAL